MGGAGSGPGELGPGASVLLLAPGDTLLVPDPRNPNAGDDFPTLAMPRYTRIIDYENMYSRIELTRAQGDNEPRGGGGQPKRVCLTSGVLVSRR